MHGQRGGETAVHGGSRVAASGLKAKTSKQQLVGQQIGAESDIFNPQLFGKPVEYYFYPNSSVPVFCPTSEQFADFEALVAAIEPLALRGGVCKIIPPRAWRQELEQHKNDEPTSSTEHVFAEEKFPIMKPIVQHFNGSSGMFHQYNVEFHRKLKLAQFFQTSQDVSHRQPDFKLATTEEDGEKDAAREAGPEKSDGIEEEEATGRVVESETVGVAVNYNTGTVQLTSAAAEVLQRGIRSEGQRARFQPAVVRYRTQPDTQGPTVADHMGIRQTQRFTSDDGRPLFVTEREYAESEELERIYWKNLLFQPPMYGADVLGTLFPEYAQFPTWNIRNLPGLLRQIGQRMPGVNDPYLYLGMWKATFAWHVEDMDLYSINYIHFGEPKAWYAIPIESRGRFEMSMQNVFANDYKNCTQFLRHKSFLLSPRFLAAQGIPYNRVVQRAGEIMLTFPLGYHAGFNHGFNCAESVNFAIDRWLDVAWESKHCECVKDSVTIDLMKWFGDARKARQQRVQALETGPEPSKRGLPRRHAAAAVAFTSPESSLCTSAGLDLDENGISSKRMGCAHKHAELVSSGTKRRPSTAPKIEPSPKRSPQSNHQREGLRIAEDSSADNDAVMDVSDSRRRFASLHTPVGTCGACLLAIDGFSAGNDEMEEEREVVECQQCGLTMHPQCSALAYDDGNYRCANCEMDTDQLSCALCAYQNGLLLPVRDDCDESAKAQPDFAHFLCATFFSETYFDFPAPSATPAKKAVAKKAEEEGRMGTRSRTAAARVSKGVLNNSPEYMTSSAKVCGVNDIAKSRLSAKCIYCCYSSHRTVGDVTFQCDGPVAQCSHPKCFRTFHPMCAAVHHPDLLDWSSYKVYCPTHRQSTF
ncbi:hypothetical protein H4R24_005570 [Coemansia sp. RSA 988]|nr:hypothetical protein H4R24_005570 [Coemansia sp. RSA 988]